MAPENVVGDTSKLFFNAMSNAVVIADADAIVLFANLKFEDLSGCSGAELEGKKKWTEFVSENDLDEVLSYFKQRQVNKNKLPDNCEFSFISKSGEEKNVLCAIDLIPGTTQTVIAIFDITARRRKEEELKKSEDRYREILSNMEEGYYETDLAGNFVFFNDSLCNMLGYDKHELAKIGYKNIYKNPDVVFDTFNRVYRTGNPEKAVGWPVVTKDGSEFFAEVSIALHCDSRCSPKGFRGVARDITDRRWAEEALQETEKYNRALLEAIPDLIFIFNEQGVFLDYNAPDKSKLMFSPETFLHKQVTDVLSPELADLTMENLSKLFHSGKPQTYEYQAEKGGSQHSYESRLVLCGREKALAIIRDITDRKRAENELKESEDKFRVLAESSPFAIMIYQNDYYVYSNPAGEKISGYSREELYNMRFWELIHPDYQAMVRDRGQQRQSGKQVIPSYDFKVLTKEGEEKWCTLTGSTTYYQGKPAGFISVIDITDRKRTEEALKQSEERYRGILATMEEGYYEVDLTGNITFCNQSAARLIGYELDEITGVNFKEVCNEPDEAFRQFSNVYKSGKPEHSLTLEMIRKDGSTVYGEFSVSPIKDKNGGGITGFRGVARDITERHRYEEQLKYLSLHDQLTDLYNRAFFENELNRLSGSKEYPVTILSADLDGLKLINDTMGHDQGDDLLVSCAEVLQNTLRSSDIITRVGGDEFAVIFPQTDSETGKQVVNRIHAEIERFNRGNQDKLPLSVSIGIATANDQSISLEEIYKEADNLMYRDKLGKGIDARSQIIQTLMVTLGERDFVAEGHARRLEDLCVQIGKKINLSHKQISNLALLAQVHDIGKVGIPDRILFKEDKLTEEEWKTMRQHAEKGYRIALVSMDLSEIADLILKHHEKWTGDGYPTGISEDKIPVECRILAVVDAYDAMTNDRPYRKAMSQEEAVAEIKRCAGTQFDPAIVEVFLHVLKEHTPPGS